MTVTEYFTRLQGKRVLVLGLGVSNRPLVRLTPGDVENLKITTPVDLRIAEAIWKGRTT